MSLTAGSGCVRVKKIKFPPFYSSHFHSYSTQLPSLIFFGGDSLSLTATVRLAVSCYTTKRIFYLFRFEFFFFTRLILLGHSVFSKRSTRIRQKWLHKRKMSDGENDDAYACLLYEANLVPYITAGSATKHNHATIHTNLFKYAGAKWGGPHLHGQNGIQSNALHEPRKKRNSP